MSDADVLCPSVYVACCRARGEISKPVCALGHSARWCSCAERVPTVVLHVGTLEYLNILSQDNV